MKRAYGGSYTVHEQTESYAIVEVSYICPYCGEDTGAYLTIYPDGFYLLESGGFYETLTCCFCRKEAEVFF